MDLKDLKFSAGADEGQVMAETESLIGHKWKLDKDRMGIEKTFYFRTYTKCQVGEPHLDVSQLLSKTLTGFLQHHSYTK
jgi:hypothetical protein